MFLARSLPTGRTANQKTDASKDVEARKSKVKGDHPQTYIRQGKAMLKEIILEPILGKEKRS